jgi:hypothetical protein
MNSLFMPPPILILGIFLFVVNCLGVDRNSKDLLIAFAISNTQTVLNNNPVEKPPALLNPNGTPLHPPAPVTTAPITATVSEKNIYDISTVDGEAIADIVGSEIALKVLEKKNIDKVVSEFPRIIYAPKLTSQDVIDDAEDIDLGIPTKDRSLSNDEKQKRIQDELILVRGFHTETRSFIYNATPEELRTMRINFTLAIAMYGKLEDSIKANPEIDQQYFQTIIEYTIQSRMLVIDAMVARGISQ